MSDKWTCAIAGCGREAEILSRVGSQRCFDHRDTPTVDPSDFGLPADGGYDGHTPVAQPRPACDHVLGYLKIRGRMPDFLYERLSSHQDQIVREDWKVATIHLYCPRCGEKLDPFTNGLLDDMA